MTQLKIALGAPSGMIKAVKDAAEKVQKNKIDWVCDHCGETPRKLFAGDPFATEEAKTFYDGWQCPLHWWPNDGCDGTLAPPAE